MKMPVTYDNLGYRGFGFKLGNSFHCGHDFNVNLGCPAYAVLDGEIVFAGKIMGFGSMQPDTPGGVVVMKHKDSKGNTFHAVYGHINTTHLTGDTLREGDVVGYVSPFTSAGMLLPHLHFGIYPGEIIPPYPWGYVSEAGLKHWTDPRKYLTVNCQ